jgi:ABC-type proline/glycine betaine transport system ATPase subunit
MWSGVELEVAEAGEEELDGPVVIKAHDVEEAERLADAIDRVRRTRQPAVRAPSAIAPAD